MSISGLYERQDPSDSPFDQESVRIDVDDPFPQMAASGTGTSGLQFRTHWVARPLTQSITVTGEEWSGPIVHKFGDVTLLPHDFVVLRVEDGELQATFRRTGFADRVRDFEFRSPSFREVTLEYDAEQGVDLILDYPTHSHPDRPGALVSETLTIDTVFRRAGFRVNRTGQDSVAPSSASGTNERWSDNEMHDAMQVHFSRLATLTPSQRNQARWALWTFFAGMHEMGETLGGIMFDSIGPAERQGTALFLKSFISVAPFGDPDAAAWVRRMALWTAVHEMGHAFNLLHAWQKHLGTPWIPQPTGYDLLTFMNYPYFYESGPGFTEDSNTIRFFENFEFRFTDDELLFLRHAPERFVIMGGERFGTNHALEQARLAPAPGFALVARVNRDTNIFDFMEPVVVELKLTNISKQPTVIPEQLLRMSDQLMVQVQKRWKEPNTFHPFAHYCFHPNMKVLNPGESIYESLFISVDHHKWLIDSPGYYTIQAFLHFPNEDVVSNTLEIRVAPPNSRDEEFVAQDYFSEQVGRVLTFDGSQVLEKANDTLREVAKRFPNNKAATHAEIAVKLPQTVAYKMLDPTAATATSRYELTEIEPSEAKTKELSALLSDPKEADMTAQALGHIDYRYYSERVTNALRDQEENVEANKVGQLMHDTLKDRGAAPHVLKEIEASLKVEPAAAKKPRKTKPK